MWAFIPKNVLPYLKYMQDPDYCHVYSVDLAPYIFDASIEGPATTCTETNYWDCAKNAASWRTILIGGMRYGGGCKPTTYTGATGVKVPVTGEGYSSYFALDITDPENPQLLWEFSDPALGFATSGPSVMRISARSAGATSTAQSNKDGRWFVVFGSGPTGGINTTEKQFLGNSDQTLKLFILDLKTGTPVRTIDTGVELTPGLTNAYAGSMLNSAQDSDLDYQDDVLYIPYVRKCITGDTACTSADGKWNNGGVLRLLTNEDLAGDAAGGGTALNPYKWEVSKVIDDAGPVTSSVVKLQNKSTGKLWIYFGTGRYYYKLNTAIDDSSNVRHLYGLKDPCFSDGAFVASCLAGTGQSFTPSQLGSVDLTTTSGVTDNEGWKISLEGCTNVDYASEACSSAYYKPERVITNPLSTSSGIVFFTTLTPYDDVCSSGGNTAIWAVKYDTGGAAGSLLQGKALIQVSTGAIEQVDLATAFTQKSGRKTTAMQGVPPTSQGFSIMSTPPPVKKVLHIWER
jgi:type IV pilus assembly protein PilY1